MTITIDRYDVIARVRNASVDDVKINTIKENIYIYICLLYMEIFKSQNLIHIFLQTPLVCMSYAE